MNLEKKLQLKELELKSLFETIRAINSNFSEADLYRIFKFIISSNKAIDKLGLYVKDERWECKVHFGTELNYLGKPLSEQVTKINKIHYSAGKLPGLEEFEILIPIKHKVEALAYLALKSDKETPIEDLDLDFITTLTNIIIVAIENKRLARKQQEQKDYKRQLEIAHNVQKLLFPKNLPYSKHLKIEASYLPHHEIGGDYYDHITIAENEFLICIADVSGKGIPAALLMSNFQAGLRTLAPTDHSFTQVVHRLNELINRNADGQNFITAFFMHVNMNTKHIRYVNAGHNPPFMHLNGQFQRLDQGTTILGAFDQLPFLEIGELTYQDNFLFFGFTDGFTETYNEAGEEFGEKLLLDFLSENILMDQKEMHKSLIKLLNSFKGHNRYADDITLVSCGVYS